MYQGYHGYEFKSHASYMYYKSRTEKVTVKYGILNNAGVHHSTRTVEIYVVYFLFNMAQEGL